MRSIMARKTTVISAVVIFMLLTINNFVYIRNSLYNFCVNAIKIKSLYSVKNYSTYETENFIIKYTPEDGDVVAIVANTIEKDFFQVKQRLNHRLHNKVQIIIYPDLEIMRNKLNLSQKDYPMGIYYGGILHILSPKVWINDSSMDTLSREFAANGPMVHELIHLIVDEKANGNFPLWFTEGIALYYEYRLTGYEWGKGLANIQIPNTLSQLTHRFELLDQDLAYRKSFEIIKLIADRYGEQKILHLLDQLGKGQIGMNSQVSLESVVYNLIQ